MTYTGHLRPQKKLSPNEVQTWTLDALRKADRAIDEAYDFDACDATDWHNKPILQDELQRRYTNLDRSGGQYDVRCDDCKKAIRQTDSLQESAAGGRCPDCKKAIEAALAAMNRRRGQE